jgi:hypothetical protein
MKSPFPGMDPYLEKRWGDVHHSLVQYARDALQPRLPRDLRARVEERVFVEAEPSRARQIIPDVYISQQSTPGSFEMREAAETAVAEPLVFQLHSPPVTEGYIEIRERGGGAVITVIEFLSPANKRRGTGHAKYLEKQSEVLESNASLVEIDLVRTGQRVLALPTEEIPKNVANDYLACISPGWDHDRLELYAMPLRRRLPILPIPLRETEPRVNLDLQALIEQAYTLGAYDDLDYSTEPVPPLSPEDAKWASELLKP